MLTLHCPPREVHALANFLRDNGAETVAVGDLDYVFTRDNALFARLKAAI
jgi:ATP phosphoribosyltransferase